MTTIDALTTAAERYEALAHKARRQDDHDVAEYFAAMAAEVRDKISDVENLVLA